jgi:hypothetical protein
LGWRWGREFVFFHTFYWSCGWRFETILNMTTSSFLSGFSRPMLCVVAALVCLDRGKPREALDRLEALFPGERQRADVLAVEVAAFLMLGRTAEARVIAEMAIDAFHGEVRAICAITAVVDDEVALEDVRDVIFSRDLINGVLAMAVAAQDHHEKTDPRLPS